MEKLMEGIEQNTIVVLDYGSQVAKLIAEIIRGLNVYSVIVPCTKGIDVIKSHNPNGIILSGGPDSVYENNAPRLDPEIMELGVPVLGICYGMHLLAQYFGANVALGRAREYGPKELCWYSHEGILMRSVNNRQVWMNHGDSVLAAPDGFQTIAATENCPVAIFECREKDIYGIQFHPEVEHTPDGHIMFRNFLFDVCGVKGNWKAESFLLSCERQIEETSGNNRIIAAVSGGVDSSTLATVLIRVKGDRFSPVFVDTGLLRLNEREEVVEALAKQGIELIVVDAASRFFRALSGVRDPEKKRKIIGRLFIDEFKREAEKLERKFGEKISFLAQGTLYPDVIESISEHGGPTAKIKSHHNVGGLPKELGFRLIEPFRGIFKAEVRRLAQELGLPQSIWGRHPFPGPGLAIRILGRVSRKKAEILRQADAIYMDELHKAGLYYHIGQAFAVLSRDRSTGQQGEGRTFGRVVHLRSVDTSVYMTAEWTRIPSEVLARISSRITGEVAEVNRVTYDITSKPPATIEWE